MAEQVPLTLHCPSDPAEYEIVAVGVGRGSALGDALSAARGDADTQLSLGIVCEGVGCETSVTEIEPVYDSSKPTYSPWGSGFQCKVSRTKKVKAGCNKRTAMAPTEGEEHAGLTRLERGSRRS
jgi:hypothetical protein